MNWVKLDLKMSMHDAYKLGEFLGRYEEVVIGHPDNPYMKEGEEKIVSIRHYSSHFTELGRLHIRAYPPIMPCQEVENHKAMRLTHYMIIEEPDMKKENNAP